MSTASLDPPVLTARDIQEELREYHRHHHRVRTTAIFGMGPAGERLNVEVAMPDKSRQTVIFETVAVACELELRQALVRRPTDAELALLVSYPVSRLVDDLQGRIAGGRLCYVERGRRLARVLNADRVSLPVERNTPLREALLVEPIKAPSAHSMEARPEQAWRALLVTWASFADEALSEASILARLASVTPTEKVQAKLSPEVPLGVAWLDFLSASEWPFARAAWRSWLRGDGKLVLGLSFLVQAAHASGAVETNQAVRAVLSDKLHAADAALGQVAKPEGAILRERMASLADRVALLLSQSPDVIQSAAIYADQLVRDEETRRAFGHSRFLPSAWDVQERRVALALRTMVLAENFDIGNAAAALVEARSALESLSQHELTRLARAERFPRARMATRVAAYLLTRRLEGAPAPMGATEALYSLTQDYVRQGGLLDWARREARMSGTGPLEDAVNAVLSAADEQRQADNRRFAQGLVQWVSAGLPSKHGHVVPIHEAVARCVVPFLEQTRQRRALIVLLDGMSQANLAELLDDLGDKGYGLLRDAHAGMKPVLAALPTLTEYSRSAFFAGDRIMKELEASTARDPQRFADLKKLEGFGAIPKLLLKAEMDRGDGHVSDAALAMVKSDQRVVAVVVNTIDEHLKSSRQVALKMQLSAITALDDLLRAATLAGRAVALCADHGHIVNVGLRSVGPSAEGTRWRALREGDQVGDDEVALSKEHAPVPRGHDRVAMLWSERTAFGSPTGLGTHGGASLPEVVAPFVWIGAIDLALLVGREGEPDPGLEVSSLVKPDWWNLELVEKRSSAKPAAEKPAAQMQLFTPARAPVSPAAVQADPEALSIWRKLLLSYKPFKMRSKVDLARLEKDVVPRVALLADHNGKLPRDIFAQKAGVLPRQVPQLVAMMQEWVNIDGESLLAFDHDSSRVELRYADLRRILEE